MIVLCWLRFVVWCVLLVVVIWCCSCLFGVCCLLLCVAVARRLLFGVVGCWLVLLGVLLVV